MAFDLAVDVPSIDDALDTGDRVLAIEIVFVPVAHPLVELP